MGWKISDLQGAALPLTGSELIEVTQEGNSRKVSVLDLLPGFDGDTLASELAQVDGATRIGAELPDGTAGTVQSFIDGFASVEVPNLAALKALDKTRSRFAHTSYYEVPGDNGSGFYALKVGDTTTAGDDYLCVVATDGGRWFLNRNTQFALIEQAGARPSRADNTALIQKVMDVAEMRWVTSVTGDFTVTSLQLRDWQRVECIRLLTKAGNVNFVAPITCDGTVTERHDIYVRDVYVNGNRQNQTEFNVGTEDGGRAGFRFIGGARNIKLERCAAVYCGSQGFNFFSVTPAANDTSYKFRDILLVNCVADWNRQHGFVWDGINGLTVRDCSANANGRDLDTTSPLNHGMRGARSDNGLMYGRPFTAEDYGLGFAYRGMLIDGFRGASNMAGPLFHVFTDVNSAGFVPRGDITLNNVIISDVNERVANPAISFYCSSATVAKPAFRNVRITNSDTDGWIYLHGVRDALIQAKMVPSHASGKCVVSEVSSDVRVDAGLQGTASVVYDASPMAITGTAATGTVVSITSDVLSTFPRLVMRANMLGAASAAGTQVFRFAAPSGTVVQDLKAQAVAEASGAPLACFPTITGTNEVSVYVASPGSVQIRIVVDIQRAHE